MKCTYGEWCGQCYENVRGRANHKGHRWYRSHRARPWESITMAIKRRAEATPAAGGGVQVQLTAWQKTYPLLWEFLSADTYEDGAERRLPTITLFLSPTGLQACLNDRDQSMAAFVTAGTLDGLWRAMEEGLKGDSLDWRKSTPPQGSKKGRK